MDVLFVRLRCKEAFEEPSSVMDLANVADLLQGRDAVSHDPKFALPVVNLFDGNRMCSACVNDTLVILDGHEHHAWVKHAPILLDEGEDLSLNGGLQMREA